MGIFYILLFNLIVIFIHSPMFILNFLLSFFNFNIKILKKLFLHKKKNKNILNFIYFHTK